MECAMALVITIRKLVLRVMGLDIPVMTHTTNIKDYIIERWKQNGFN